MIGEFYHGALLISELTLFILVISFGDCVMAIVIKAKYGFNSLYLN